MNQAAQERENKTFAKLLAKRQQRGDILHCSCVHQNFAKITCTLASIMPIQSVLIFLCGSLFLDQENAKRPPWKDKAWEKWTRAVCVQFLFVSVPEFFYFFMSALC